MFKEQMEKIKDLIIKKEANIDSKRKIENLVIFLIILIVTIIIINSIWKGDDVKKENSSNTFKELASNITENKNANNSDDLEERLESILSKMDGVGKVKALITYSQTNEVIAMYNESKKETSTQEADSSGGNREIKENDIKKEVIYTEENGISKPVTQTIISPKIEGAVIIAQGASNANTKANIISAVEAITGVPTHKIQVFEMTTN